MPQDEKAKEQPERDSAHHEEVHCGDPIGMIAQEGLPALRRRSPLPRHVFRHARLPDIDTELEELSVDPRRTPKRVGKADLADQPAYLKRHLRSSAADPRSPAPVGPEPPTVPTNDRLRLDTCQDVPNTGEQPIEADKYQPVDVAEKRPLRRRSPQDIDLLAQHEVLRCERRPRSQHHQKHRQNESAKVPHRTAVSLGSSSPATRITFAIGTPACRYLQTALLQRFGSRVEPI